MNRRALYFTLSTLLACSSEDPKGNASTGSSSGSGGQPGDAGPDTPDASPSDITWVSIPAGTYDMGCSPGDSQCFPDELPSHTVDLSAFQMADTETTQARYLAVTGESPSGFSGCDDCPVDSIDWDQASQFCAAVGGRLPTEAEWEYAARGGTTTRYPCGTSSSCLDEIAWYEPNARSATHPVKQKGANGFGLYDVIGNVLEFVSDRYDADYYASSPASNPPGPRTGNDRVLRGGTWDFSSQFVRVSLRNHDGEAILSPPMVGVRCARD